MTLNISPKYTFLPWLRKGISNKIDEVENKGATVDIVNDNKLRTDVKVKLNLKGDGAIQNTITKTVNLLGPGDIIGLNNQAIIKTEPANALSDFEPNYLASIDFYDEEFVWRYSPATSNAVQQLRPWLFLVVLKEDEFTREDPSDGVLPSINISAGPTAIFLPKSDELAMWAHVHVNGDLSNNGTISDVNGAINRLTDLVDANPDLAISRIICPRKLEENTNYHAFLIPTYETGRLAGLGIATEDYADLAAQLPSWKDSLDPNNDDVLNEIHQLEANRWPVYFNWFFQTGNEGDFESLVRRLEPRVLDDQVGRRPMDIQNAGFGLNYSIDLNTDPVTTKNTLSLEGALTVPDTTGESYPYPDNVGAPEFRTQLQDLVNLNSDLKDSDPTNLNNNSFNVTTVSGSSISDDPIISPSIYGRWHALKERVSVSNADATGGSASWIHELNLDPRNRVVAGIGSEVLQANQDQLMDQAWDQLGEVIDANKKLYWAQLARETSRRIFEKHVDSQPNEKTWSLIGKMKRRVLNTDAAPKTYYHEAKKSQLPLATDDRAFRRIARPIGPVMKKIDPLQKINKSQDNLIFKLDTKVIIAAQDKVEPVMAQTTSLSNMETVVTDSVNLNVTMTNFSITGIGVSTVPGAGTNPAAVNFKAAISELDEYFNAGNWTPEPVKPAFDVLNTVTTIKDEINPLFTISARVYKNIIFDNQAIISSDVIIPVLAYPKFRQPMYESIRDLSTELLIPNLNLVPNNTISLLQTNQKFIESYMVGLNHEMGRELLWREYPTDQRGSYFRQFWDVADNVNVSGMTEADLEENGYDISEIHTWGDSSKLGENSVTSGPDKLVLLIRGDLLRKYPNAVIYAVKADWARDGNQDPIYTSPRVPVEDIANNTVEFPIFSAKIDSDITFLGFNLTIDEAKGVDPNLAVAGNNDPGYFFVIKERPGEVRFGMDVDLNNANQVAEWNDLHWGLMPTSDRIEIDQLVSEPTSNVISGNTIAWNQQMNAAEMAMILYQNPVKISIHAREMLTSI